MKLAQIFTILTAIALSLSDKLNAGILKSKINSLA
jgi:hypothetical protein